MPAAAPASIGLTDITDLTRSISARFADFPPGKDNQKLSDNSGYAKYPRLYSTARTVFQADASLFVPLQRHKMRLKQRR
ncbi:MAG: hypothetical protein JW969_00260 [Spirochaetales bacterium]|nr:hypothetical protein [Spirochaetales bacterium]